jgi:type IV pilus assembly protein PilV
MTMRSSGFSIIEVMVSMLIVAFALLGLAALQTRAQQAEFEIYQRSQALLLVDDMAGRLRANHTIADCYVFADSIGSGTAAPTCTTYTPSDRRDRVDADLAEWTDLLDGAAEQIGAASVGSITGARGCITELEPNLYMVSVAWLGITPTLAPANDCGAGLYGDERLRRVVSTSVRVADLGAN